MLRCFSACASAKASAEKVPWPKDPFDQVAAVLEIAQGEPGPFDVDALAGRFRRATRKRIDAIVGVLLDRRLLVRADDGRLRSPGAA